MRASRQQTDAQERKLADGRGERAQRLVVQDRLLHALARSVGHEGLVDPAIVKEQVGEPSRGIGERAMPECEVFLFHFARAHLLREVRGGRRGLGVDHHAANAAVEAVDHADIALDVCLQEVGKAVTLRGAFGEQADGLFNREDVRILKDDVRHGRAPFL